jgi:simple sugar transport system ATP-binding protein
VVSARFACHGLTKAYGGALALDDVSMAFNPGEVHCLAGENGSGKSTLIKIMSGVVRPDAGIIHLDGTDHSALLPRDAVRAGVHVIFQDFSLLPNLTVAENIALSTYASQGSRVTNPQRTRELAERALESIGVELDLEAVVRDIPVSSKQLVAIARAMNHELRLLFMDEPTTTLTRKEVARLFEIVQRLSDRGVATVFVSHKLDEVTEIAQHLTVLRNGRVVTEGPIADYDRVSIAQAMTGEDVVERRNPPPAPPEDEPPMLEVRGLGRAGHYEGVDLQIRRGEVVGLTGLLGSGRSDIAESLFGVLPPDTGSVTIDGQLVDLSSPRSALAAGIGYVPADRLSQGLFLKQSIRRNTIAAALRSFTRRLGWLRPADTEAAADAWVDRLRIKIKDASDPVTALSGGNQQRVVLAKWLATEPRVFILNAPTVGVDIGSKQELLRTIARQAEAGIAVLIVSDDIPELVQIAHRVLVVRNGRLAAEIRDPHITVDHLYGELAA